MDAEHMQAAAMSKDMPYQAPSAKEIADMDRESMEMRGGGRSSASVGEIGGSRPGVGSRVKGAIEKREGRGA